MAALVWNGIPREEERADGGAIGRSRRKEAAPDPSKKIPFEEYIFATVSLSQKANMQNYFIASVSQQIFGRSMILEIEQFGVRVRSKHRWIKNTDQSLRQEIGQPILPVLRKTSQKNQLRHYFFALPRNNNESRLIGIPFFFQSTLCINEIITDWIRRERIWK
jgi:hypothetical protein